ncbi:CDC25-like phosphatase Ych1p [[Candida] railenensis]|uniref:CDC25-like phosphatase Ych1p n=1 Tax=[Candida] railenensis TaxID=45579 RepID=A0A9P0W115_9ASCO|nr:CDC25-like phosphatase Ych1p [[Candida] railenensis]
MSNPINSLDTLKFVEPTDLKSWFQKSSNTGEDSKIAVVDVRDNDFEGGHIKGALNFPSETFNESLPELHKKVKETDAKDIVFHCMSSKNRGTRTTIAYLDFINSLPESERKLYESKNVWVLKGGFVQWQKDFGKDKQVTEDFDEDLWRKIEEEQNK